VVAGERLGVAWSYLMPWPHLPEDCREKRPWVRLDIPGFLVLFFGTMGLIEFRFFSIEGGYLRIEGLPPVLRVCGPGGVRDVPHAEHAPGPLRRPLRGKRAGQR
jgi:hypothetical protein